TRRTSGRRENVNDPARQQRFGLCRVGRHMRCGRMGFERAGACPFLDHDESVRAEFRLQSVETLGIDDSAVFDAALFCMHSWNIGTKSLEHHIALAWFGRDDCNDMDHECRLLDIADLIVWLPENAVSFNSER